MPNDSGIEVNENLQPKSRYGELLVEFIKKIAWTEDATSREIALVKGNLWGFVRMLEARLGEKK